MTLLVNINVIFKQLATQKEYNKTFMVEGLLFGCQVREKWFEANHYRKIEELNRHVFLYENLEDLSDTYWCIALDAKEYDNCVWLYTIDNYSGKITEIEI